MHSKRWRYASSSVRCACRFMYAACVLICVFLLSVLARFLFWLRNWMILSITFGFLSVAASLDPLIVVRLDSLAFFGTLFLSVLVWILLGQGRMNHCKSKPTTAHSPSDSKEELPTAIWHSCLVFCYFMFCVLHCRSACEFVWFLLLCLFVLIFFRVLLSCLLICFALFSCVYACYFVVFCVLLSSQ